MQIVLIKTKDNFQFESTVLNLEVVVLFQNRSDSSDLHQRWPVTKNIKFFKWAKLIHFKLKTNCKVKIYANDFP
jgi:hypothetical protein